jgi:hypothetical protein
MKETLETVIAFMQSKWEWILEKTIPVLLEKLQPTFSFSQKKWGQSTVVTSPQPDGTTMIQIDAFISVTNHMNRELCLTGAHFYEPQWGEVEMFKAFPEYIPAQKTLPLQIMIFIRKPKSYYLQNEISTTLCIEGNNHRKKCIRLNLKNITNQKQ